MSKDHRLVIKIDDADNEWLSEQEEELGIDKVSIIRMMIRRHRKAGLSAAHSTPVRKTRELIDPALLEGLRPEVADGEVTGWSYDNSPTEAHTEEFVDGEDAEAAIEDLVSARLSEAKVTPVVTVNEYGGPTGNVRPLSMTKRPAGKGWMK